MKPKQKPRCGDIEAITFLEVHSRPVAGLNPIHDRQPISFRPHPATENTKAPEIVVFCGCLRCLYAIMEVGCFVRVYYEHQAHAFSWGRDSRGLYTHQTARGHCHHRSAHDDFDAQSSRGRETDAGPLLHVQSQAVATALVLLRRRQREAIQQRVVQRPRCGPRRAQLDEALPRRLTWRDIDTIRKDAAFRRYPVGQPAPNHQQVPAKLGHT